MSIRRYMSRFFGRVERTPVPEPTVTELVDGKAFTIKHYPLDKPFNVAPTDTITATIPEVGKVQETVDSFLTVDTISTIRFNDALGYKHAIGALFGQRKP